MPLDLPYDEGLARDVIAALQGHLFDDDFDARSIGLNEILSPLDERYGVRMNSVTEGPGRHEAEISIVGGIRITRKVYAVPEGKVFATIDTITNFVGSCDTYIFTREEHGLTLEKQYVHLTNY